MMFMPPSLPPPLLLQSWHHHAPHSQITHSQLRDAERRMQRQLSSITLTTANSSSGFPQHYHPVQSTTIQLNLPNQQSSLGGGTQPIGVRALAVPIEIHHTAATPTAERPEHNISAEIDGGMEDEEAGAVEEEMQGDEEEEQFAEEYVIDPEDEVAGQDDAEEDDEFIDDSTLDTMDPSSMTESQQLRYLERLHQREQEEAARVETQQQTMRGLDAVRERMRQQTRAAAATTTPAVAATPAASSFSSSSNPPQPSFSSPSQVTPPTRSQRAAVASGSGMMISAGVSAHQQPVPSAPSGRGRSDLRHTGAGASVAASSSMAAVDFSLSTPVSRAPTATNATTVRRTLDLDSSHDDSMQIDSTPPPAQRQANTNATAQQATPDTSFSAEALAAETGLTLEEAEQMLAEQMLAMEQR